MDLPNRKRLPHTPPQWVSEGSFFFITINCASRGPNRHCRAGLGDTVIEAAAFYHKHFKWHCRLGREEIFTTERTEIIGEPR